MFQPEIHRGESDMYEFSKPQHRLTVDITTLQDDSGFLLEPGLWTEELACQMTRLAGLAQLTPAHWRTLHYLRDYYGRTGVMPPPRVVCRHLKLQRHDVNAQFGSCLQLWKIAGLPCPDNEIRAHLH
jgi:dissimilatory sulfite reductase related protein